MIVVFLMEGEDKRYDAYLKISEENLNKSKTIIISGAGENADDAWNLFMKILSEIEKRGVDLCDPPRG